MFQTVKVAPSILSADFLDLNNSLSLIEGANADWVHIDVMDGHFVPNITMGVPLVKQLREATQLVLDCHLMVSNPLRQIPWFIDSGADFITFHFEALSDKSKVMRSIELIHQGGVSAGIAVKPNTPIEQIKDFIPEVEMVLVMSVEPGFSGQSYIEGSDDKVASVSAIARKAQASPLIQVDGGISRATLDGVVRAGADVLVCGNAFFKADDPILECAEIKGAASRAQREVSR